MTWCGARYDVGHSDEPGEAKLEDVGRRKGDGHVDDHGAIQGAGYGDGLEDRRGDGHGDGNGHVGCSGA